jgi:asparaginyl-tRNA synthetase
MKNNRVIPPKSWVDLSTHYRVAINNKWYANLSILEDEFTNATVDFYRTKGIRFAHLPITTGSISSPMGLGSDSSPVEVNISGNNTYLADSMQFFLEYACRINKKGAYYIAPSFRGELADERHLCQFFHSEAEIPGDLNDVIVLCQDYLKHLVTHLLEKCQPEIKSVTGTVSHLKNFLDKWDKIPRCTFEEAVKILGNKSVYVTDNGKFRNINRKGEKKLINHFGGYVWLTHFDHMAVPFYQKNDDRNSKKAVNADLLMGIGETIGSGERHSTAVELRKALKMHGVEEKPYKWYLYMKEKYPLQTSGFGLGVERFLLWVLKHDDIRDCQLLPRFNGVKSAF